jgi:hypothetical protein
MGAGGHYSRDRHHHGGQGLIERHVADRLTITKQGRAVLAALLEQEGD